MSRWDKPKWHCWLGLDREMEDGKHSPLDQLVMRLRSLKEESVQICVYSEWKIVSVV
jgi:hypothetical protein